MKTSVTVSCPVEETPRVLQVRGIFDMPFSSHSVRTWMVDLPIEEFVWNLGLIVGPSGCGKTTIARQLWPEACLRSSACAWPDSQSVLDAFPDWLPVREVVALLSAVSFSSPPDWLKPYHVLSTGQQFRVALARMLAQASEGHLVSAKGEPSEAGIGGEKPRTEEVKGHVTRGEPGEGIVFSHPTETPLVETSSGTDTGRAVRSGPPIVCDEFTSVVDRTVAKVGSAAVAKVVRARHLQFVAVTCHEDVEEWLCPDWVYRPATNTFTRRLLQRRPAIEFSVTRVDRQVWRLFAPHHYLSGEINRCSYCFLACWKGEPVAFSAWIPHIGRPANLRREHRTVCLPDFQGVGIGNALSDAIASMWHGLGYTATSSTTHPAMIRSRLRSPNWRMTRKPRFSEADGWDRRKRHATTRLTAGFTFVGKAMPYSQAHRLLNG